MSIDLYRIYQLDRQQPPEALAQQLERQLVATDPSDSLTRGRIETARVILGDPSRRAVYDQQLGDPSGPPITEQTLAALAGRPVPAASPLTLSGLLASTQGKILAGGAAAVALILLLVIAVAAISGDEDGGGAATATSGEGSSDGSASEEEITPNLFYANVGGTVHKRTGRDVIPPQRIRITESVNFAQAAESIGYDEIQQARCGAPPTTGQTNLIGASAYVTTYDQLVTRWGCDGIYYAVVFDIGGESPVVAEAAQGTVDRDGYYSDPLIERIWNGNDPAFARKASVFDMKDEGFIVDSPDQLPVTAVSVAKTIGVKQATVITAIQVEEDESRVYFLVPDSLSVWVGELEANPDK